MQEPNTDELSEVHYPDLSDRIQSTFIDTIFIVIMMFVFASILERFDNVPDWIRISIFVSLWVLYEPACTAFGVTIGNYAKGIRVRKVSNHKKKINIFQAIARYVVKITLGWISFLTIHLNPERRAIHDFAASSVMIKHNQN